MPKAKKSSKYQKKMVDGKENPKYVDLLDEDKAISGQNFVVYLFFLLKKLLNKRNYSFLMSF